VVGTRERSEAIFAAVFLEDFHYLTDFLGGVAVRD
jgi:hypothetical protein